MIRKLSACVLLCALVLTGCATAPNPGILVAPATVTVAPSTAIQHVVVIFGENISFDHYFGTYPNAANTGGTTFTAAAGTPTPNNYISNPTLLTANPNLNSANGASAANPFRLATAHQVGGDQGLLPAPVPMKQLLIAPAERADLLIDFSSAAGRNVHLVSGLANVMQFRVGSAPTPSPTPLPSTLRPITRTPESAATVTRTITLTELDNQHGDTMVMLLNKTRWHQPVTETPKLGATEIWEFVNLTEDTHPMHLHLVRFQILDRRVFDDYAWRMTNTRRYLNDATPPEPHELGWKDVVQCPPTQITRIIATFDGYAGRYLYHCHILEHEANDMMRPFEVIA
jgi:FtsP/CotA-like multicopper oxidase with cupredoxin domain